MPYQNFGGCDLHIPHKEWSGDPRERDNYASIEQWAQRLKECGSCACSVEQSIITNSVPDSNPLTVQRSDGFVTLQCGGPTVTSHLAVVHVAVRWVGNNVGVREAVIQANLETGSPWGLTVPGCSGGSGFQHMTISRLLPSNAYNNYAVILYQTSGGDLDATITFTEYYPCCDCDWAFPC